MTVDVATVGAEAFAPHVGDAFVFRLEDGRTIDVTLASVRATGPAPRPELRAPFSLVFHARRAGHPSQGTLRVEHPTLGAFEAFAVPLQPEGDVAPWEIVFG